MNEYKQMKIKPPLTYQGAKVRVAEKIVNKINKGNNFQYIDMCCGAGSISIELLNQGIKQENITMIDNGLIGKFYEQISKSKFDIEYFEWLIDKIPDDKHQIKNHLLEISNTEFHDESDIIPYYMILQAGSFGGKHIYFDFNTRKFQNVSFRNYWQPTPYSSRKSPVNPMMPMPNELMKRVSLIQQKMSNVNALCLDADLVLLDVLKNKIVFIDPPYMGVTGYGSGFEYSNYYNKIKDHVKELWVTDYINHSEDYYILNKTSKGGISGNSTKKRTEILSKIK